MDTEKEKQVTELSLDELLASAETETPKDKEVLPVNTDDVTRFLAHFNIQSGDYKVRRPLLYAFYKEWSKDALPSRIANPIIDKFIISDTHHFYIDKRIFDIVEKIRLLQKTKKQDFTRSKKFRNHIEYFCTVNQIARGDFYVSGPVLYILYKTWCINNGFKVKFNQARFHSMFKLYFEYKPVGLDIHFRVTTDVLKYLSKEQLEKVNKNVKKKKPKKPSPIPRFVPRLQPRKPRGGSGH